MNSHPLHNPEEIHDMGGQRSEVHGFKYSIDELKTLCLNHGEFKNWNEMHIYKFDYIGGSALHYEIRSSNAVLRLILDHNLQSFNDKSSKYRLG